MFAHLGLGGLFSEKPSLFVFGWLFAHSTHGRYKAFHSSTLMHNQDVQREGTMHPFHAAQLDIAGG